VNGIARARKRLCLEWTAVALGATALCLSVLSFAVPAARSVSAAFAAPAGTIAPVGDSVGNSVGNSVGDSAAMLLRILASLKFTVSQALLSSALAVAIGLPAGFFVARREFPGRRALLAASGVPLCVPPMIVTLAFVLFYGRQGTLNSFLMGAFGLKNPPITFLYSFAGIVIAHGFYNFPVVLRTVSQVWERLPREEEEAATLLGAGPFRVFRTVTLPRLSGAILSSAVLVFLYCFFSFIIVMTFGGIGGTSLEVELYRAARSSLDFRMAGAIAIAETVPALLIVVLYSRLGRRLSADTEGTRPPRPRLAPHGFTERLALAGYLAFILAFFAGPLLSILVRSFVVPSGAFTSIRGHSLGLGQWMLLLSRSNFAPAVVNTVRVAVPVALISTLAAVAYALAEDAFRDAFPRERSPLALRVAPLAPLAVSSVALGFGWGLLAPRGNAFFLVLAQSAMAWPFAWTQVRSSLDRIPQSVRDAASLASSSRLDAAFRVRLPLASRGIVSAAAFSFAISAGDASLPLVLSMGKFENLPLLLFRLAGSYRFSEACACTVVLALICGVVFFAMDSGGKAEGEHV